MSRYLFICSLILSLSGCAASVGKDNSKDIQNENTQLKVENATLKVKIKQLAKYCNPNTDKECPIEGVF